MWTPQYDIIVETLTGSQFEVTVTEKDTVGYIKSRIQKYEGIPVDQQHLIYNHKELLDKTEIKDIPLVKGSTVKLVLDMKVGPVSARRVVTLPGYDKWFDLSDVLSNTGPDFLPVKLLFYKDCKKNIHRVMKLRADRKNMLNRNLEVPPAFQHDDEVHEDQWLKDNIQTLEKMRQLKSKLDKKKKFNKKSKDATNENLFDDDDDDDLLKDNDKLSLNIGLNENNNNYNSNFSKLDRSHSSKFKKSIENEIDDVFLDGIVLDETRSKYQQNKTFSLSPRRPVKNQDKSNFSRFFHHRNSSPTLNSSSAIQSSSTTPYEYTISSNLDKNKTFSQSCNYISENRTKLRDNIRRNRSFKLIDNDLIIEENEPTCRALSATHCSPENTITKHRKTRSNSGSIQELNDHGNSNRTKKEYEINNIPINPVSSMKLNKRWNTPKLMSGYENKLFVEKEESFPLNYQETKRNCSDDFKLENGNLENSFRVYKMTSEAKNCYELPKLLIREDSPVESYHSSDSQLETIALRGNSPKNVLDSISKLNENETKQNNENEEDEHDKNSTNSLLKLYDSANQNQREHLRNMYEAPDGGGGGGGLQNNDSSSAAIDNINQNTWNYHSDLGLNKLELSFLNDELSNPTADISSLRKSNSVLKIASSNLEINKWKNISQLNGLPPEASASLNFINGDISSSDDDDNDDVFNSCELLANKSKSVELNEFRMMFGSSPTLLNTNNYNFNPITQTSRLDAVPFQYRRGYSNLNDACLSSSTSDLECFQNSNKKKIFHKNKNNTDLPSLYRHRNNEHLDYVRSYENLDRTRIVRMRNERVPSTKSSNYTNLTRDRCLQEEDDSCDNFSSYSNLCFDNDASSVGCIGAGSINRKGSKGNFNSVGRDEMGTSPIGYPSDESIFNINFDTFDNFEDDVLEIDTLKLFENSIDLEPPTHSITSTLNSNTLLLPDINNKFQNMAVEQNNGNNNIVKPTNENKKSKTLRCAKCNKKLGVIMIMKCHCENIFCAQHRYAEAHNCTYNFKTEGKKIIAKENPLIIAQKLPKI